MGDGDAGEVEGVAGIVLVGVALLLRGLAPLPALLMPGESSSDRSFDAARLPFGVVSEDEPPDLLMELDGLDIEPVLLFCEAPPPVVVPACAPAAVEPPAPAV